jgi:hypothetical protein
VAEVSTPLLSVSKICEKGHSVLCKDDKAYIIDAKANVIARFEKRNGLYHTTLSVKNPRFRGFQRQAK